MIGDFLRVSLFIEPAPMEHKKSIYNLDFKIFFCYIYFISQKLFLNWRDLLENPDFPFYVIKMNL